MKTVRCVYSFRAELEGEKVSVKSRIAPFPRVSASTGFTGGKFCFGLFESTVGFLDSDTDNVDVSLVDFGSRSCGRFKRFGGGEVLF